MPLGAVLREKPLRNEAIRIGKYLGIPVEEEWSHDDICSGGNQFIFDDDILADDSGSKHLYIIYISVLLQKGKAAHAQAFDKTLAKIQGNF